MRHISSIFILSIIISCSNQQSFLSESSADESVENFVEVSLQINEYSPKSNILNEYDDEADWIELYNSSTSDIEIKTNSWSISDDENNPEKYFIPACTVAVNSHLVIWCDGRNEIKRDFHSNFKLSGNGEQVSLYHEGNLVDEIIFEDDVKKKVSYGRVIDGSNDWTIFKSPSPGSSNQSFDNYAETLK